MRILHVVPTYLPATRYGGPIYAVHGLCRALAARGHDVDVFTTNVDGDGESDVPLGEPVILDGVRVHYFASSFRRLYVSPGLRRALAEIGRYDVAHLHSVFLWPTWAAGRAAHRAGVPYVIAPRGMLVPELIRRKSRLVKTMWIRLVERRTFGAASGVHFTSQKEMDDAALTGVPLPSPFVVPNGIDLPPAGSGSRRAGDLLLFLGRINWKKGLERLVAAMAGVPDARLVVAGNDDEHLLPALRTLAEREGVAGRVEFLGPVAGDAKEELLRRATALVLPSYSENFGNVVIEAMAASTPVVVTPEVGLAGDVAASGAGVVVSNEPSQLAAALRDLLRDEGKRTEMGRRGRSLVERRFTWPHVAAQMEEAYRCSIESRR